MSVREQLYKRAAAWPVRRYFEAWGEILNQSELNDLMAWFASGGNGDPPANYIKRLGENPKVAKKVESAVKEFQLVKRMFRM